MRLEHLQESQQAGAEVSPDGIISKALALGRHLQLKPLPVMEFFHLCDKYWLSWPLIKPAYCYMVAMKC